MRNSVTCFTQAVQNAIGGATLTINKESELDSAYPIELKNPER